MARTHKLTSPVRISFLVKAGEQPPLRVRERMTKHVKVSFLTKKKVKMRSKPQLVPPNKDTKIYARPDGCHYHLDRHCIMLQGGQFEKYGYQEITPTAVKRRKLHPCPCAYKREVMELRINFPKELNNILGELSRRVIEWQKSDMPDFNKALEIISEVGWANSKILTLIKKADYVKLSPQQLKILETCSGHHL